MHFFSVPNDFKPPRIFFYLFTTIPRRDPKARRSHSGMDFLRKKLAEVDNEMLLHTGGGATPPATPAAPPPPGSLSLGSLSAPPSATASASAWLQGGLGQLKALGETAQALGSSALSATTELGAEPTAEPTAELALRGELERKEQALHAKEQALHAKEQALLSAERESRRLQRESERLSLELGEAQERAQRQAEAQQQAEAERNVELRRHAEGGSKTQAEGGSRTQAEGGSKTQAEGGSKTQAEGGSKTQAEGGSETRAEGGSKTQAEGGSQMGESEIEPEAGDSSALARAVVPNREVELEKRLAKLKALLQRLHHAKGGLEKTLELERGEQAKSHTQSVPLSPPPPICPRAQLSPCAPAFCIHSPSSCLFCSRRSESAS